jgi:hypothetical protein
VLDSASELIESRLLVRVDLKNLIETSDPEDLEKVGMNATELELALDRRDLLLEVDQLAERRAGEILHVPKVQQDGLVTFVLNQAIKLVADLLDVLFGHDLGIDEADNGHSVNIFEPEMTARTLRHRD